MLRLAPLASLSFVTVVACAPAVSLSAPAHGGGPGPTPASYGLHPSIRVPQRAFRRGARIELTVSVRNISRRVVLIYRDACPYGSLFVQVLNASGVEVYPPEDLTAPPPSCPAPGVLLRLRPGRSFVRMVPVILRGRFLRPVVLVPSQPSGGRLVYLYGQRRMVRLLPG